ncbi:MAG TPA: SMC-Scp complex subunit ScpB [Candidatus Paceibacterota bacterium]
MNLEQLIEAILFYKSEPVDLKWLCKVTDKSREEVRMALSKLKETTENGGVVLIENEEEVSLGTSPGASSLIEKIRKEELEGELGKAGLETLTVILYKGPISKTSIEYVRGVNSQYTIHNLLIRGLIEKIDNPGDARSVLYKPTTHLLLHLGIENIKKLPEYEIIKSKLNEIENASKPEETQSI